MSKFNNKKTYLPYFFKKNDINQQVDLNNRKITLLNIESQEVFSFNTCKDAASFLKLNPANFNRDLKKKQIFRTKYKVLNSITK